jgi:Ca2+-binding EF-hand superfamily protein
MTTSGSSSPPHSNSNASGGTRGAGGGGGGGGEREDHEKVANRESEHREKERVKRVRALFDLIDDKNKGYLDSESLTRRLDALALERTSSQSSSLTKTATIESNPSPELPAPTSSSSASTITTTTPDSKKTNTKSHSNSNTSSIPFTFANSSTRMYATELVKICDSSKDGTISFAEFDEFVSKKEAELEKLFIQVLMSRLICF